MNTQTWEGGRALRIRPDMPA